MVADQVDSCLDEAWLRARASGVIGETADRIRLHAAGFVPVAWRVRPPRHLVDLGSGAGVPGLHLAVVLQGTEVTLMDSSSTRSQIARQAALKCGLGDRVDVQHGRLEDMGHGAEWRGFFDAAVARRLGSPAEVAELGLVFLRCGGRLVVSANDPGARWWETAPLHLLGAEFEASWVKSGVGRYVSILKIDDTLPRYPRRAAARARTPWPGGA